MRFFFGKWNWVICPICREIRLSSCSHFTVWLPACIVTDGKAISRWLRIGPGGAMEAIIHYQGHSKFEATARGHRVVCDQPVENGERIRG